MTNYQSHARLAKAGNTEYGIVKNLRDVRQRESEDHHPHNIFMQKIKGKMPW